MQGHEWDIRRVGLRAKPQRGGSPMHRTMAVPVALAAPAAQRAAGAPFVVLRAFALGLVFWVLLLFAISIAPGWALGQSDGASSSNCPAASASCGGADETLAAGTPGLIGY